jgi:hypothetical protein
MSNLPAPEPPVEPSLPASFLKAIQALEVKINLATAELGNAANPEKRNAEAMEKRRKWACGVTIALTVVHAGLLAWLMRIWSSQSGHSTVGDVIGFCVGLVGGLTSLVLTVYITSRPE